MADGSKDITGDDAAAAAPFVPHGFADDEAARFLRRRPPPEALAWVERVTGAPVAGVRALRGGSSSALHAVRMGGDAKLVVVLRRYVRPELNEEEPDLAAREANTLRLLEASAAPSPALLDVDPSGAEAGTPAVLMERLPGRLVWVPDDLDRWLRRMADALPPIHATPVTEPVAVQPFRPYRPRVWEPPEWLRDRSLWERAVAVFHGPPLDDDRAFTHRDYHPGNVLWWRRKVTGVVDWQAASIGPRSADAFWCAGNLIRPFGLDVAHRFIAAWEEVSGCTYHPWAEVAMFPDILTWGGDRTPREAADLERELASRLSQLGV